ncbi:MAG: Zn-dependent oligopeptidase [Gemmatimonadetes bacterium]|nr:Zn-dependent oligopeptidase [Gemmatimonadota bacterium]
MKNRTWTGLCALAVALTLPAAGFAAAPTVSQSLDYNTVSDALARADAKIAEIIAIPADERTFENTMMALDDLGANLELETNLFTFMAYVSPDAELRAAAETGSQEMRNWGIDVSQNEDLYRAVREYADTNPKLEGEHKRFLEHTMRGYRRAGMDLSKEDREKLTELKKEIGQLSQDFDKNIREYESHVPLTEAELAGTTEDYRNSLTKSGDLYLVGMSYPEFNPISDWCSDETTRRKVWVSYKRRGGQKNVRTLEQLVAKRAEAAKLLGYETPAHYEVEVRMSKDPKNVHEFYKKLRPLVRKKAELDYAEFVAAKRADTGDKNAELYPWDTFYYKNRLMKEKYAVDAAKVQEYFPLDAVTDGLFSITQSLYGLEYKNITERARKDGRHIWHEDVEIYEVWDNATGKMLGEFSIDLHPRDNKYGHAAHWGMATHKVWSDGSVTLPVSALVCNFTKPTPDKPSLLTHDEVETYFHEFGHCLHNILSTPAMADFSGPGVERDLVEAPSQMFENWIWDADVLGSFSRHYETGEPLPKELLDGMIAAKNLGSGMLAERQFFYGLYDFTLHSDPEGDLNSTELGLELWGDLGSGVELYAAVPETYFQAAFGHLTGYQAGYYGYQWALVYASDMFQRFNELGMLNPEAGKYYREKILSKGGSMDGLDLVKGYLGRDPDYSAYLKHLGLDDGAGGGGSSRAASSAAHDAAR